MENKNSTDIGLEDLRYVTRQSDFRQYNELTPLRDGGETYAAMLSAIAGARESIHLETYILVDDDTGTRFADALIERARDGVTVRVLYDAWGSWSLGSAYVDRLTEAGVQVIEYNPVAPWRAHFKLVMLTRRDHRKILVVDTEIAFTGGLNIANEYASVSEGGGGWRDAHVQLEGPIVHDLAHLFQKVWTSAGGEAFAINTVTNSVRRDGHVLASVIENGLTHRYRFQRAYLRVIDSAVSTIDIMNAYFIPGRSMRRALKRAVARGVDVRVIVPGKSDVRVAQYAIGYLYACMLKDGIRIFEWPQHMMHAKTAVIDGIWSTIGSYNFDNQSLRSNLEVAVAALDRPLAMRLGAEFDADVRRCVEIDQQVWAKRGWWRKSLEWGAYRVRRLL